MNSPPPVPAVPPPAPPLRLWPALVLLVLMGIFSFVVPRLFPASMGVSILGTAACGLLIILWWLLFSRAPWSERLVILLLLGAAVFATSQLVHPSIRGAGMGFMLPIIAVSSAGAAIVVAAVATRRRTTRARRIALGTAVLLGCGVFTVLRTGGMSGAGGSDFHWRWSQTPEERLLARGPDATLTTSQARPAEVPAARAESRAHWPGFRGPNRDSVVRGTRIETDWAKSPPVELWRREVGPGWSSFAVDGGLVFTQEQLGGHEAVSCYNLATGERVWRHQDAARFYESNAGPGPRGTPTLHEGRVYTFGATGIVNALDARTGAVAWSRNAGVDTKKNAPDWGFASSPLVAGDVVVVAATGTLIAYDRASGEPRWTGPADGKSYSSPHLLEIDGVPQIVLMSGLGATSVAPADGKVLWQHAWPAFAIVQPAQIANGDLLISTGDRIGARRLAVKQTGGGWTAEERWTSNRLKAYFNDFVLHRGHAYGFDGGMLTCVGLDDGARKWKGGRHGNGQVLLLAEQDVLVVLGEQGGLALVAAAPDALTELARCAALEGKTWNHPVIAGDVLLVRNDREMIAFKLATKD